jgi:hypothetical protein
MSELDGRAGSLNNLDGLWDDLLADAVAGDDCDLLSSAHGRKVSQGSG